MKIGILGPHGSGKTTLCHELMAELKKLNLDFGLTHEVARYYPFSLELNQSNTKIIQGLVWLFNAQQNIEIEESKRYQNLICDRTVIDRLGYASALLQQNKVSIFYKQAEFWINHFPYTILFKTKINHHYLVPDNYRNTDIKFQETIDLRINEAIKKLNLDVFLLPEKNPIDFILDHINQLNNKI